MAPRLREKKPLQGGCRGQAAERGRVSVGARSTLWGSSEVTDAESQRHSERDKGAPRGLQGLTASECRKCGV